MHTRSWAELLKHLLCLFIFIDGAAAVVYMIGAYSCKMNFIHKSILPLRMPVPSHPIDISADLIFIGIHTFGFVCLLVTMCGLVGICCLNSKEVINFTFGVLMVQITFCDFAMAHAISVLVHSYDLIIEQSMVDLFISTNKFNVSKHVTEILDEDPTQLKKSKKNNPYPIYNLNFTKHGWSLASEGGFVNQSHVDYIQLNLKCCGLTGRSFWDMRIPRSCCSNKYRGDKCVLSVARSHSCLHEYHRFTSSINLLRSEFVCFGIIAMLTAMDSLYLAYLRVQFPDGDYKSDKSSDEEEEGEMANI